MARGVSGDSGGVAREIRVVGITGSGVGAVMMNGVWGMAVGIRSFMTVCAGSILSISLVGFSPPGELAVKMAGN